MRTYSFLAKTLEMLASILTIGLDVDLNFGQNEVLAVPPDLHIPPPSGRRTLDGVDKVLGDFHL